LTRPLTVSSETERRNLFVGISFRDQPKNREFGGCEGVICGMFDEFISGLGCQLYFSCMDGANGAKVSK